MATSTISYSTGTLTAPSPGVARVFAGKVGRRAPGRPERTVLPMAGRLPVSYFQRKLRTVIETTIDQVPTDTVVTTSGVIRTVRRLEGNALGRTMIVIAGEGGHSSYVTLDADVMRLVEPAIRVGTRIHVHGLVIRTVPSQPAGIEGLGVQVEVA